MQHERKTRSSSRLAALMLGFFVIQGLVTGCGSGGGGETAAGSAGSAATSGTVVVRFATSARERATELASFSCTGADSSHGIVYGPVVVSETPSLSGGGSVITLMGVPFTVTSLLIQPLAGGQPTGAFERPLSLGAGSSYLSIDDGLASFSSPSSLALTPARPPSVAIGATQAFQAMAVFADGSRYDFTDQSTWSATPAHLASVSTHGVLTALKGGTAAVQAASFGVTGSATQVISPDRTTLAVTTSGSPSVSGQSVIFTATIQASSGVPTGPVTFLDGVTPLGAATLSGGQATLSTSSLAVGMHAITVTFAGDAAFAAGTSPVLSQAVSQDVGGAQVGSSANPSEFGQSVTFTATVTATPPGTGTPTGTVNFLDGATSLGTATLSAGQATVTTSALTMGSHSITAVYGGDTRFSGSTSPATTQVVTKCGTSTALSSSVNPALNMDLVTFTATVEANQSGAGTPTGTVTFKDGSTTLLAAVSLDSSGQATCQLATLTSGTHSITASYSGNSSLQASTSPALEQVVDPALFVANGNLNTVLRMALDGTRSSTYVSGMICPFGLAFDGAGNLWVTASGSTYSTDGGLYRVAPGGGTPVRLGGTDTWAWTGLAFDPSGTLYVANSSPGTVSKLVAGGTSLSPFVAVADAAGVATDSAGRVYVADVGTVSRWNPDGSRDPSFSVTGLSAPCGLAFDSFGALYVSCPGDGTVRKVGSVDPFASGFDWPAGLAFDATGNLYVGDMAMLFTIVPCILRVTPLGVKTLVTGSPPLAPFGLVVR